MERYISKFKGAEIDARLELAGKSPELENKVQELSQEVDRQMYDLLALRPTVLVLGDKFFENQSVQDVRGVECYLGAINYQDRTFMYDKTTKFSDAPEFLPAGEEVNIIRVESQPEHEFIEGYGSGCVETIKCEHNGAVFKRCGKTIEGHTTWSKWLTIVPPSIQVDVSTVAGLPNKEYSIDLSDELAKYFPFAKSFPSTIVYSNSNSAVPAYFSNKQLILAQIPPHPCSYLITFSQTLPTATISK